MKAKFYLLITLLLVSAFFAGCRPKSQSNFPHESSVQTEEYGEEVVIMGRVLNRDVYPQEKELTLIIPFFSEMENKYRTPIQEDGSFSFRFPVYAKIREVSIRNYAEHLYVHPGDSLHVEIDFKDMFHPQITGNAEKLNQEISAFTESAYYYIRDYTIGYELNFKDFEVELKKEHNLRLERRNEYMQKYKPMQDVALFTEELLKQDYYYALLLYATQRQYKTSKELDRYRSLLPEINKLYEKGIFSARLFDVADEAESYVSYGIALKNKKVPTIEEIMSAIGENALNQYLYTKLVANSLSFNDTLSYSVKRTQFDSIVKMPHLRAQVAQMYVQTKSFLENPKPVSDHLLYGTFHEDSKLKTPLSHMEPIYTMLEKDQGKVIYIEFWARWCPPCLREMEPLKELRSKYSTKDLIICTICTGRSKKEWEECLEEYSMRGRGIECLFALDYFGEENFQKIKKQLNINGVPYYILINRKGQIMDYGTAARPSNSSFVSRIDEAVNSTQ